MAGKTGTSQVRRLTAAERAAGITKNEDLPWRRRDHGLFVGFAPVHKPRYACAIVVEHGGGGSKAAAPIARDIPTADTRVSPPCQGSPKVASFQSRLGIIAGSSPGRSTPDSRPSPKRRAIFSIRSIPTRRDRS